MQRRAEQSARDKARAQRLREERAKAPVVYPTNGAISLVPRTHCEAMVTPSMPAPKTPLPLKATPVAKRCVFYRILMPDFINLHFSPYLSAGSSSGIVPSAPPPVPLHTRPKIELSYSHGVATLLSPPMTPEDLQTIPIPEDLFAYEPPPTVVKDSAPSSPALSLRGRGQGVRARGRGRGAAPTTPVSVPDADESGHVGNSVPCRFLNKRGGCARGAQCTFSHVAITPRARRTALEEELAKKTLGE
jgi:hypothetical protein